MLARAFERLTGSHVFVDEDEQARSRVLVWLFPVGLALCVLSTVAYVVRGHWDDAALTLASTLLMLLTLEVWRRTASFSLTASVLCTWHTALWVIMALHSHDLTALAWLCFGPLMAFFLAGSRTGVAWLVLTLVISAGLSFHIVTSTEVIEVPLFARAMRIVALVPVVATLGLLSQLSRERAMKRLAESKKRAEAASEAKTRFLASVSHEIRTPLNGMLGTCELALTGELATEVRDHLKVIQQSGATLMALINDLLDLSKAEAGRLEMAPHAFSPGALVEEVTALHRSRALAQGIELTCTTSVPPELTLWADSVRLRQVLHNLVGNALKFGRRGSVEVDCSVTRAEAAHVLLLTVTDHGRGMRPEEVARLFQPFTQLRRADALSGTGLGLAISYLLVKQMGGELTVKSTPEVGSTFLVTLQLVEALKAPNSAPSTQLEPLVQFAGRSVLIVDDNAINLRVASGMVERLGLVAETAGSGQAALDALERKTYDLVLMDLQMPDIDGAEATRRVRRREGSTRHTPIIALTASALASELAGCREAGMDETLTKPLQLARLREVLERFLGAPMASTGS